MKIMKLIREIIFFRFIKPPFFNRQGKLGDFPDLAKLNSDFRNKAAPLLELGTKDVLY